MTAYLEEDEAQRLEDDFKDSLSLDDFLDEMDKNVILWTPMCRDVHQLNDILSLVRLDRLYTTNRNLSRALTNNVIFVIIYP